MYHRLLTTACCVLTLFVAVPALAQTPSQPSSPPKAAPKPPAVRRWVDVQSLLAAMRYRFTENSAGRETVSDLQYQSQLRGRFLFDKAGHYHIGTFVTTGSTFRSGWNYTGAGINRENHPFKVRQLWLGAAPVKGLEFQAGGLTPNRGELADVIASDNDSFVIGGRATVRPSKGWLTQVSAVVGYFDAASEPDLFKQLDDADHVNYAQALAGFKLGARANASVDYTYENGRDILREGVTFRVPATVQVITGVRLESYQRVEPDQAAGFNASADLKLKRLTATIGVMKSDRAFGPFNGDRYELGSHHYYIVNYPLTPELSLQAFYTRAFDVHFPITIKQRFDFAVTYNPTAYLKRKGVL